MVTIRSLSAGDVWAPGSAVKKYTGTPRAAFLRAVSPRSQRPYSFDYVPGAFIIQLKNGVRPDVRLVRRLKHGELLIVPQRSATALTEIYGTLATLVAAFPWAAKRLPAVPSNEQLVEMDQALEGMMW